MATGDSDDDVSDLSCVVVYVGTREKETLTENVQYKVKERSLYASGAWPANGNEQTAVSLFDWAAARVSQLSSVVVKNNN